MNDDDLHAALVALASKRRSVEPSDARLAVASRARRYRRRRRLMPAAIAAAAGGVVALAVVALSGSPHAQSVTVRSPASTGTVVGHIDACSGMSEPKRFVGGSVVALRGRIQLERLADGVGQQVLPALVVARRVVPAGGEYRFDLPAGHYVIDLPHYRGSNTASTHVSVVIHPQHTVHADLPNACM
jgi:hypothetical protein